MNSYLPTAALALLLLATSELNAHGIVRREGANLPIASSVTVPAGTELLFVGGTLPDLKDADPAAGKPGLPDTAAQARSVLGKIQAELAAAGYGMGDIVRMEVYLVADPNKNGLVDVMGLMSAYLAYFGKDAGGLPTRTTVQVAGLPVPGALVQIAVTAARTAPHHHD
jgi:enamine deaminase RidA (YjgF/YER057c/UK114 family)